MRDCHFGPQFREVDATLAQHFDRVGGRVLLLQIEEQIELKHEGLALWVGSVRAAQRNANLNYFKAAHVCSHNLVLEVGTDFVGEKDCAGKLSVHRDVAIAFGD